MESNQTVAEQVVNTIISGIQKGTFKPGQKLPSQRELAEKFGVSRMVVREAVKILEGKGVVYSRKGSGIYVKQNISDTHDPARGVISIADYSLRDSYTLYSVIILSCTDMVIQNASDEELAELYARTKNMYDNYGFNTTQQEKYIYETSFGLSISRLTHNKLLYKIMVELLNVTSEADYQVIKSNGNYKSIIEIDLKILEALMNRDLYRTRFLSNERELEIRKAIIKGDNTKGLI